MRFRTPDHTPLEINFIPLIDVLLVMLIFLAATTTFTRQHVLKITLPQATVEAQAFQGIELSIHESGRYALNGTLLNNPDLASLTQALRQAGQGQQEPAVLIRAAASASHQLVITAMQAARQAAIVKVYFATLAGDRTAHGSWRGRRTGSISSGKSAASRLGCYCLLLASPPAMSWQKRFGTRAAWARYTARQSPWS